MMEVLHVQTPSSTYPIYVGEQIYQDLPALLEQAGITTQQKLMIITDAHVGPLYADRIKKILDTAGFSVGLTMVPAGETSKTLQQVERVIGECIRFGLDRKSIIIALGGGVIGDLAGFVAASYMRGIDFIQLPTTLLAHDSSVGGKVGVNHPLAKNYIGAFHQPLMVLFDLSVLQTLPERELRSGFAEVIKHGLIWDRTFAEWLMNTSESLLKRDPEPLQKAIYRGCQIKAAVVSADEKEQGLRSILNYGHTIGHALEAVTNYQFYTHGEAIAIGMAGAIRLSQKRYDFSFELVNWTEELISRYQLPIRYDPCSIDDLLSAMQRDKKVKRGEYTFVLAKDIGEVELVRGIEEEDIREVLRQIRGVTT